MVIRPELAAQILRLYHAEKWPVGTIARQLSVHHTTVTRVLTTHGVPRPAAPRGSMVDSFVPFLQATLGRYPKLAASRLCAMCRERGFLGHESTLRRMVARLRPRPPAEAYLRLKTFPGEQAQADWAHFGKLRVGRAERLLLAFVLVLSYSRRIFLRFFLGGQTENFLRGHEAAFAAWHGVPRVVLYDRLKSAVLESSGSAIRFNPILLAFCGHYHFEPRPVAVARGNEKGRVERAIGYVRENFFAARQFRDVEDLNRQAQDWCDGTAMQRPWPEDRSRTVAAAFAEEQPRLMPLPADGFPVDERCEVHIGKTPYARFDSNDYSVPHELVRRTLVVVASLTAVRVLDGSNVVAEHARSFSRHEQIEDVRHIQGLVEEKRAARKHHGYSRLFLAAKSSETLIRQLAERGENLGSATSYLLQLLDEYGADALEQAITAVLQRGVSQPQAVRQVLDQQRQQQGEPPRTVVHLPDDPRVRDLVVTPHSLDTYDAIARASQQEASDGQS